MIVQTPPCTVCREPSTLDLDDKKFSRWAGGELIQSVFPDWTPAQRELLITGIHASCWSRIFAPEEEGNG